MYDGIEAKTKYETARHAAPVHSAATDNPADRCRNRTQSSETARHTLSWPRNPTGRWGITKSDATRTETKSETARHTGNADNSNAEKPRR